MRLEALTEKSKEIFPCLKEFTNFYLADGTALSLQIGHRISDDFNFFCTDSFPTLLFQQVQKVFKGKNMYIAINNSDELVVFVNGVKITFSKHPFPILYKFVSYKKINFLNIKEIAAIKAYTIGKKAYYQDYIDLYFTICQKYVSLKNVIKMAEKKYSNNFNPHLFLEQLINFQDIEDADIIFLNKKIEKEKLQKFFKKQIKKIKL